MFPMETCFVARDNSRVLTVKLGHETSLVAYSTDKRSKSAHITGILKTMLNKVYTCINFDTLVFDLLACYLT